MASLRKDYYLSIHNDELIISFNPNGILTKFEDMEDLTKRYLYKEGDKIVTPFGIETIKEINRNYSNQHGYEWLILVEENGNQYKPCEIIGIYVKTIKSLDITNTKKYYWIEFILTKTILKNGDCYSFIRESKFQKVIDKEPLLWLNDFNKDGETIHEKTKEEYNHLVERYKLSASMVNWNPITEEEYLLYKDKNNEIC